MSIYFLKYFLFCDNIAQQSICIKDIQANSKTNFVLTNELVCANICVVEKVSPH